MKPQSNFLIWLMLLFAIISCQTSPDSTMKPLKLAEKLMEVNPDSALKILREIPDPEELTGKVLADYGLLMAKALDKNYLTNRIDTTLLGFSIDYYDSTNDIVLAGIANFYYGRRLLEGGKNHEALDYLLKAKSILESTDCYKELGLIYEEIGDTNIKLENYDASLADYKRSLHNFEKIKDSTCISYNYRNIGRTYLWKANIDSASFYYNKALDIANTNQYNSESSILSDIGLMYRKIGKYKEAEDYFFAALEKVKVDKDKYSIYLSLGYLYYLMGKKDNAEEYYKLSIESPNLSTAAGGYIRLYWLERSRNNFERAILYKEKSDSINYNIQKLKLQEKNAELTSSYENEKYRKGLFKERNKNKNLIIIGILILFPIGIVAIYFYLQNKNNKRRIKEIKRTIFQNENRIIQYESEIDKYKRQQNEALTDNYNKISELKGKIIILDSQNKELNERLGEVGYDKSLTKVNDAEMYVSAFRTLILIKEGVLNRKLDEKEWELQLKLFDYLFYGYVTRLRQRFPNLTKHDLEICCLLRLGCSNDGLSRAFLTTNDSVTKAKGRLKKRLDISGNDNLEVFLRNF